MAIKKEKTMKEILDEQPKVSYLIPYTDDEELPYTAVTINGYRFEIKHGERVEIPESVARILDNSNETLRKINQEYRDMTVGSIRKLGRVDHRNTALDTHQIERERGITVFSKQAQLRTENMELCLLDTPGHADLTAETERVLDVLDYALLVISGTDGVQAHTETLWHLLERHRVPTIIFATKMDLTASDREKILGCTPCLPVPICMRWLSPGENSTQPDMGVVCPF